MVSVIDVLHLTWGALHTLGVSLNGAFSIQFLYMLIVPSPPYHHTRIHQTFVSFSLSLEQLVQ
jgi:hypothetical protein